MNKGLNGVIFIFLGAFTICVEVYSGVSGLDVNGCVQGALGNVYMYV